MKDLSKNEADDLILRYKLAWQQQRADLLPLIFAADAMYLERYYSVRFNGLKEIEEYWHKKVIQSQRDIRVNVKHVHISGRVIVAEWEAEFFYIPENKLKRIYEVAILEVNAMGLVTTLREFWDSDDLF